MIVLGMVSLSSIHSKTTTRPRLSKKPPKKTSILKVETNSKWQFPVFSNASFFSHLFVVKPCLELGGGARQTNHPKYVKFLYKLVAWNLYVGGPPCWSYPLLPFFLDEFKFSASTISCQNLSLQESIWAWPWRKSGICKRTLTTCHMYLCLNFCFKKSTFTVYVSPGFFAEGYVFWLAQNKNLAETRNESRPSSPKPWCVSWPSHVSCCCLQIWHLTDPIPEEPKEPKGTTKESTTWVVSARWVGCWRFVGMVGLGGFEMMEPRPSTDRNGRLGHWQLSMPFIANLFSSDSAEPCRFFPPWWSSVLPTLCWANVGSKRLQINCLNWF